MTPPPRRPTGPRTVRAAVRAAAAVLTALAAVAAVDMWGVAQARGGPQEPLLRGPARLAQAREEIRTECMRRRGFRYVPYLSAYVTPIRRDAEEARARDAGEYPAMRRFREKYGFGVFALYAYPREFGNPEVETDAPVNPNNKITMSLSRTQLAAYWKAGDACYSQAVKMTTGKDVTSFADHMSRAEERVDRLVARELDGDRRLAALGADMARCLRRKGYPVRSATPSALARRGPEVFHAEEKALGRAMARPAIEAGDLPDHDYAPSLTPADATPYLTREIRAALDDLECGRRFYRAYEPGHTAIVRRGYVEYGLDEWLW
ncbi:hypothetical protein [Sphaerisporangium album]|uniref:hypothetical protein n=1 Tax=Sphaerisporangium album TaxID=509200 RepID=UPI0015F07DFF|nr:hypothetical protein [Sphaerisporangium album]